MWYKNTADSRYGPQTAYTYLSKATEHWTNIPIIESFNYEDEGYKPTQNIGYQSIITEKDNSTGKYITTITPYSLDYGSPVKYENMRVRLPYINEITTNTSCKLSGDSSASCSCPNWMVNYLYVRRDWCSKYSNNVDSKRYNSGYFILSSDSIIYVNLIINLGYIYISNPHSEDYGLRPVITILKSDLLRVMK